MDTLYLYSSQQSAFEKANYVDSEIFSNDAIFKMMNLIKKIKEHQLTTKITNHFTKKIRVLDYYGDSTSNDNDTDDDDTDDDDIYNCHIIEGENWKIILIEELGIILDTKYGLQLTVHAKGGHPGIISHELTFNNSDGSTSWTNLGKQHEKNITMRDVYDILYHLRNRILEYCFN